MPVHKLMCVYVCVYNSAWFALRYVYARVCMCVCVCGGGGGGGVCTRICCT